MEHIKTSPKSNIGIPFGNNILTELISSNKGTISNILKAEKDYELLFLDLLYDNPDKLLLNQLDEDIIKNGKKEIIKFNFGALGYIKVIINGSTMSIEMIHLPNRGTKALLFIIKYAIENGITTIHGEANPRKKHSHDMDRRLKILVDFYSSFGFFYGIHSGTGGMYMTLPLDQKGLLEVFYNKTKVYLETGKWPTVKSVKNN